MCFDDRKTALGRFNYATGSINPELATVAESLTRIDNLVNDVLALSKEGQYIGEVESVDIQDSVREAWKSVDTQEATVRIEDELGSITADKSRFRELLANLFRNTIEHAGSNATVRVGSLSPEAGVYIADDGPGIPESLRSEIFTHGYSVS